MHVQLAVVLDEAMSREFIQENMHVRDGSTDHFPGRPLS
jgi:hypothetical protein